MTAQELINELKYWNPDSQVFIRDGHHFMRRYAVERVENDPSQEYATPGKVILIGAEAPKRD